MKFYRLNLISSSSLTIIMFVLVFGFDLMNDHFRNNEYFHVGIAVAVIIMFSINYVVLELLFSFYAKKEIQKISHIFVDKDETQHPQTMTFKDLEDKFADFSLQKDTEMDMMKEMENYRKEYIGNVSHELKTPLFSIQGYVETLLDGGVENLNIRDKYLQRIEISVERLIAIVNDLDMINRLETGEINLSYSVFDVNLLIKEIFDLLDLEAQKKSTHLLLQSSQNAIFVSADKQKIAQVFINLISNAIHYANRKEATVWVKTTIENNKVNVEVIDNGVGIKPELLNRIFERFYRVETSRSRREGGSGLGLAIVKHILEAHQQTISVKSEYLEGANFSFQLKKA